MPKLAAYDDLMTSFMREHKPPGAALAVTYHGRLVYARGFGHANLEKREPVRPASLFRIASVSKPFTATAVMHLIEQGKLQLDDRVFPILKLQPHLERGARLDLRWHDIKYTKWHTGLLAGSSTLLVCRADGINWAVLFNSDAGKDGSPAGQPCASGKRA